MSFLSDIAGKIFGSGFSNALPDLPGSFSDIFTPQNIIGAIKGYGDIASKNDASNQLASLEKQKEAAASALSTQEFNQQMELLKLKASLGGGGGGGGGGSGAAKEIARNQQIGLAYQNYGKNAQDASTLTVNAIKNLLDASTRPLMR